MARLGVFGGTFDPVHIGHLLLAERAREQLELDTVLWVPAGDPWRKSDRAITPATDRVEMVRLAIEGNDAFELSVAEVERNRPSYTAETLIEISEERPGDELFLILGEDALEDLPNWKDPDRIAAMATLAVAHRHPVHGEDMSPSVAAAGVSPLWLQMPRIDISATDLRERVRLGRSIRYAVPDAVERYIRERGLYA